MSTNAKKLTLVPLVLMVFTSVFGFSNITRSFYLMGYGAVIWYILAAILFFIPFAFMMAEFGTAFKDEKGGIYTWMERSVGPRFAFAGVFMWYTSYVIWMVNISSSIWVTVSNMLFGTDTTAEWHLLGFESAQLLPLLGILWMIGVTYIGSKGLKQITKVTSVGGTAVACLNLFLLFGALFVLISNGGQLAEPVQGISSFYTNSPNADYTSMISILSFVVFALFAYGGIEAVAGLAEKTKNPEKTFPRAITISAIVISVGYAIGIFLVGTFTNWGATLSGESTHLGNVLYVIMNNLGYNIGMAFGLSQAAALDLGMWVCRFVGLSMFLALSGAFFTLTYSPLKQLVQGTPKALWPKKFTQSKHDDMPVFAMWVQCFIVVAFLTLLAFGGDLMAAFFEKLTNMTNVAMTLPYMFLSIAYIYFKKNQDIKKPFEVFKRYSSALIAGIVVTFTVGFANFFTLLSPVLDGDYGSFLWMVAGPALFSVIALVMYGSYQKKGKANSNL